jgi:hypothetical protein
VVFLWFVSFATKRNELAHEVRKTKLKLNHRLKRILQLKDETPSPAPANKKEA